MSGIATQAGMFVGPGEGGSTFDPTTLFSSSETGHIWDISNLDSLFQERTSQTTSAGVGDPVGSIVDQSGNSEHWSAISDAGRPVLRESSGRYYLEFDNVDDYSANISITFSASNSLVVGLNPLTDNRYYVSRGQNILYYLLRAGDGQTFYSGSQAVGSPNYRLNAASWTPTNGDVIHDALTNQPNVLTIESLDLSAWTRYYTPGQSGSNFLFGGYWYGEVMLGRAFAGDERANLEGWMATKTGASL